MVIEVKQSKPFSTGEFVHSLFGCRTANVTYRMYALDRSIVTVVSYTKTVCSFRVGRYTYLRNFLTNYSELCSYVLQLTTIHQPLYKTCYH